jgi:peptide-methionine (S)-S-oxide reductase
MSIYYFRFLSVIFFGGALLAAAFFDAVNTPIKTAAAKSVDDVTISKPVMSPTPQIIAKDKQTAIFAGGCFWGVEAVFEHIKGVSNVTSGYTGDTAKTANYKMVSAGKTRHAEAVKVTFDPSLVSYEQLLKVFFLVAHDPTELNRQGPDIGTQYRSSIFYSNEEQKQLAENYIAELTKAKTFARPIVTQIVALDKYYKAEDYHQDYLVRNPNETYIVVHDKPKLKNLRKRFPDLYVSK